MIKPSEMYYLYVSCLGHYYILTQEELDERDIEPEYERCEMCGECDELIDTFYSLVNLACYLKSIDMDDNDIIGKTGVRVITERVGEE